MAHSSIQIIKERERLLACYTPEYGFNNILEAVDTGCVIKNTFHLSSKDIVTIDEEEGSITFSIAKAEDGYYLLDKNVFEIKHNIYMDMSAKISHKWFVIYPRVSLIQKLDSVINVDLHICAEDEGKENYLPYKDYEDLLATYPNSYEIRKYVSSRVSSVLANYVEGTWKNIDSYERYLNRKEESFISRSVKPIKLLGYEMYAQALERLKQMLKSPNKYSEKDWQAKVYEIICVLYPKYIASFREIDVGDDGRHSKHPDFLLVDSAGFIDVMEIKKPNDIKVVSSSEYRDNYIAGKDLEGAIVQIEKYVYILNHGGEHRKNIIKEKISKDLPNGLEIRVVNPQGILILGRSEGLTKEQLFDFEIIKRQHKNIVDIMTYDDLVSRFENILTQMDSLKALY